jgi:uncharacterized protein (DUF433 family)
MPQHRIPLGIGIYYPAEAARFLQIQPGKLRRWVNGYTYWLAGTEAPRRRHQPPVTHTDLPPLGRARALSFLELMELRVVIGLRSCGLSLQAIRAGAALARRVLRSSHPFASHRVFTDGKKIFTAVEPGSGAEELLIELARHRHAQVILGDLLTPFLREMEFDPVTGAAQRWWPLGKEIPVVLDPRIAFGAPVVAGTALRTVEAARMARRVPVSEVADAYELPTDRIKAAVTFEAQLAAA